MQAITIPSMQVARRKRTGKITIAGGLLTVLFSLPGRWSETKGFWQVIHGAWWLSPTIVVVGFVVFEWEKIEPYIHDWIPLRFLKNGTKNELAKELGPADPIIVPEPGWSYFHWDEIVYQERPLILRNRGGGDAKDIHIADMSNRFGMAKFRDIGFIASNDSEMINPSVDNYDSAPMIRQRDLAHLVDAEFSPIGQKEGSIKISIEYKDVNNITGL